MNKPVAIRNATLRAAWERTLIEHEWFDGEDEIAASVQSTLIEDWMRNEAASVTTRVYGSPNSMVRYFPTFRAAWEYAVGAGENESVTVTPYSRVRPENRAFFPPKH
jgi:hypothetical protein